MIVTIDDGRNYRTKKQTQVVEMIVKAQNSTTKKINQSLRRTVESNHCPLPRRCQLSLLHRVLEICDEGINERER